MFMTTDTKEKDKWVFTSPQTCRNKADSKVLKQPPRVSKLILTHVFKYNFYLITECYQRCKTQNCHQYSEAQRKTKPPEVFGKGKLYLGKGAFPPSHHRKMDQGHFSVESVISRPYRVCHTVSSPKSEKNEVILKWSFPVIRVSM